MKKLCIVKLGTTTLSEIRKARGDYEDWISLGLGLPSSHLCLWRATEEPSAPPIGNLAGVVLTGSPAMVTDREDWSLRVASWLPSLVREEIPLLGICYGHQLLASALGGVVDINPKGIEKGTVWIRLSADRQSDELFSECPETMAVQSSHKESVLEVPPEARRLGGNAHDPNHVLAYGSCAWGVQFHPEFDVEIIRTSVQRSAKGIRAAGRNPETVLREVAPTPHAASLLSRFGTLVARREGWELESAGVDE
jgi:GMP synthase (glutamine-hydrolysing)